MDQLIFIVVLIFFAILDGIAKKKKAEAQRRRAEAPLPEETGWSFEVEDDELPTYDSDPSFDDRVQDKPASAAEKLIPKDVWEEIAALARGEPIGVPAPREPEPAPAPIEDRETYRGPERPTQVEDRRTYRGPSRPDHEVHLSHERYGTPVSDRLAPLDTPDMHRVAGVSAEVGAVRALLSGGGSSLRKAVILQEVLGPPKGPPGRAGDIRVASAGGRFGCARR